MHVKSPYPALACPYLNGRHILIYWREDKRKRENLKVNLPYPHIKRPAKTKPIVIMVKGKATATISGRTVAETDEYEVVEGNIYVRMLNIFERQKQSLSWRIFKFPPSWVQRCPTSVEFPEDTHQVNASSVNMSYFSKTDHTTHCPWKGDASYYNINLDSESAAWPCTFSDEGKNWHNVQKRNWRTRLGTTRLQRRRRATSKTMSLSVSEAPWLTMRS